MNNKIRLLTEFDAEDEPFPFEFEIKPIEFKLKLKEIPFEKVNTVTKNEKQTNTKLF